MTYQINKIENPPLEDCRILVFRGDQKVWEICRWSDFSSWIGNQELAYTHWCHLPDKPFQYRNLNEKD